MSEFIFLRKQKKILKTEKNIVGKSTVTVN